MLDLCEQGISLCFLQATPAIITEKITSRFLVKLRGPAGHFLSCACTQNTDEILQTMAVAFFGGCS